MPTAPDNPIRLCKKADCSVSSTGKCLEGLEPEKCPNLQIDESPSLEISDVLAAPEESRT